MMKLISCSVCKKSKYVMANQIIDYVTYGVIGFGLGAFVTSLFVGIAL